MNERVLESAAFSAAGPRRASSLSLGGAFAVAVLLVAVLSALAFWPSKPWAPPHRPSLSGPAVFDDFVNAPNPSAPLSTEPGPSSP